VTVTVFNSTTGVISRQDIAFDSSLSWTTSWALADVSAYAGTSRQLAATLTHEFGHVFGLNEEPDEPSIMGQDWDHVAVQGTNVYPTVGGDAMAGAVDVYGEDSNVVDMGVLHWKWTGTSNGYPTHGQTQAYRSMAKLAFPKSTDATLGMTVFQVPAGKPIVLEFVYENMGSDCQTPTLQWYSSTNQTLNSSDTLLLTNSWQVCPGNDRETMTSVTIPAGTSGRRYAGPVIANGETGERARNNISWLPLDVVPEGHADFCKASKNCLVGEGDCDSNSECASGLTCREEGAIDRCR
jgi:hypothetical protein